MSPGRETGVETSDLRNSGEWIYSVFGKSRKEDFQMFGWIRKMKENAEAARKQEEEERAERMRQRRAELEEFKKQADAAEGETGGGETA